MSNLLLLWMLSILVYFSLLCFFFFNYEVTVIIIQSRAALVSISHTLVWSWVFSPKKYYRIFVVWLIFWELDFLNQQNLHHQISNNIKLFLVYFFSVKTKECYFSSSVSCNMVCGLKNTQDMTTCKNECTYI